ncbi:hypothetical protein BBBOND_0305780 [Babesia bigemina]|uniref:Uncharacterized protein n=1 Tax=Babesia bigemina TaxID=5866 RepID=A0A061DCF1_BABBI|nr:hypothetical protein BBBOND_0305780 [Babesia bigemina]CDR96674.1 hypothetical protein BBBOND_0305780 [Babesia bigemina]|eukprot:XP_012768860.1 hypothetical protein BBBOND_0305780 [Babesia bigemina]
MIIVPQQLHQINQPTTVRAFGHPTPLAKIKLESSSFAHSVFTAFHIITIRKAEFPVLTALNIHSPQLDGMDEGKLQSDSEWDVKCEKGDTCVKNTASVRWILVLQREWQNAHTRQEMHSLNKRYMGQAQQHKGAKSETVMVDPSMRLYRKLLDTNQILLRNTERVTEFSQCTVMLS